MNAVLPSTIVVPMVHRFLAHLAYWFLRTIYPDFAFALRNVFFCEKYDVCTREFFEFQLDTAFQSFLWSMTSVLYYYSKDSCIGSLWCPRDSEIFGGFDMGLRE